MFIKNTTKFNRANGYAKYNAKGSKLLFDLMDARL